MESEFLFEDDGSARLVAGGTGDGTVEIVQHAVLDGDAFVSSGLTVVRFADGSTTREVTIRIAARRIA